MTTPPVPSDTDRLAEIRRRLAMAKIASSNAPDTFWHTFVEDTEHLLNRVKLLEQAYEHAKKQRAKYEQRVIGWREQCSLATRERDAALVDAKQLQGRLDTAEGQLATARAELDEQRWYGEQLQASIEGCSGNHLEIEEYPGDEAALDLGHEFLPVNGHPDDDECTFRNDGTDLTYCGEPKAAHARALGLGEGDGQ